MVHGCLSVCDCVMSFSIFFFQRLSTRLWQSEGTLVSDKLLCPLALDGPVRIDALQPSWPRRSKSDAWEPHLRQARFPGTNPNRPRNFASGASTTENVLKVYCCTHASFCNNSINWTLLKWLPSAQEEQIKTLVTRFVAHVGFCYSVINWLYNNMDTVLIRFLNNSSFMLPILLKRLV